MRGMHKQVLVMTASAGLVFVLAVSGLFWQQKRATPPNIHAGYPRPQHGDRDVHNAQPLHSLNSRA